MDVDTVNSFGDEWNGRDLINQNCLPLRQPGHSMNISRSSRGINCPRTLRVLTWVAVQGVGRN